MAFGLFFNNEPEKTPAKPAAARAKKQKAVAADPSTPAPNEAWAEPPKPKRQTKKAKE